MTTGRRREPFESGATPFLCRATLSAGGNAVSAWHAFPCLACYGGSKTDLRFAGALRNELAPYRVTVTASPQRHRHRPLQP